jgi:putative transposase
MNGKLYNESKYKRLYSLHESRKNKINAYINKLIMKLKEMYQGKKFIILGYNEGWKQKVNLGNKTNRKFYQIPYLKLIEKLREQMEKIGVELILTEESYTSRIDSLMLEDMKTKSNFSGERMNRGLFSSKMKKLINADLNGAINIMRKKITLQKVEGKNLFNPIGINKILN